MKFFIHQETPCGSPQVWETNSITKMAELPVIYSGKCSSEDKCFESCILSNCCNIDALFDVLQKIYKDRQSNLGTFLHAVQVSWIPNTIYSYIMSQFNSDKCYWLQTLSWTKYSQCRRFVKIKSHCEIISVLLYFPTASATQCFAANEILHTSFRWSLLNLLYVLSYGFELSIYSLSQNVGFFSVQFHQNSKLRWICNDWCLSILISV